MNEFFDNPGAFSPFFDDTVSISGNRANGRRVSGSFLACVLDLGYDDPIAEGTLESDNHAISVTVRKSDWMLDSDPQVGDVVVLEDGRTFAVKSVVVQNGCYIRMEARQK